MDTPPSKTWRAHLLLIALLALSNVVVFGQTVRFEFLLWDDETFVVRHVSREGGLTSQSIAWAFSTSEYGWRTPLTYLSLFADAELYGLKAGGYHLTNLLIHLASTFLLFSFLRESTQNEWASFVASALFAIHPLHVEPVAWVTGRWELLCGFFWMLGLVAYRRYCASPSMWRSLLVLLAYLCAIASKPMALTFPFALLLLDYWPLGRLFSSPDEPDGRVSPHPVSLGVALGEKIPLFLLTAVATLITLGSKAGDVAARGLINLTWKDRIANSIETYVLSLASAAWPADLTFFYLHPSMTGSFSAIRVACFVLLLMAVTLLVVLAARRHRYLVVGWIWYLGVFTPAIGWLQVENHARADRYTYLPLIGVSFVICWGLPTLLRRVPGRRAILAMATAGALLGLMYAAQKQAGHWRNSRCLFEHGVAVNRMNYKALIGLGTLAARDGQYDVAASWYKEVTSLLPGHSQANYLLGRCYLSQGQPGQAIPSLRRSIDIEPNFPRARHMLALAFTQNNQPEAALKEYQWLLETRPSDPQVHRWCGDYYTDQGQISKAEEHYRRGLSLDPANRVLPQRLGHLLNLDGRPQEAARFYAAFLRDHPHRRDVSLAFAWLLATHSQRDVRDGSRAMRIALSLITSTPHADCAVLDTLAAAYAEAGQFQDAQQAARQAIELATAAGNHGLLRELESRRALYLRHQPYHQTPLANSSLGGEM